MRLLGHFMNDFINCVIKDDRHAHIYKSMLQGDRSLLGVGHFIAGNRMPINFGQVSVGVGQFIAGSVRFRLSGSGPSQSGKNDRLENLASSNGNRPEQNGNHFSWFYMLLIELENNHIERV